MVCVCCMGNQQPAYRRECVLRTMYNSRGMTIEEISDHFDISTHTVHRWMVKNDIRRRYTGTLRERFEQYHEKNANEQGCWLWQNKPDQWGYGTIVDGDRTRKAHRVAFDLFRDEDLPEFSPDTQLNHTCHNPDCVNPDHLYIGTQEENMNDALDVDAWGDNRNRGSDVGTSKLTEEEVIEIKERCLNGEIQKEVAKDYPVSHSAVNKIMVGEWWKHVGPDVTEHGKGPGRPSGEDHTQSKLTEDDVRTIRKLRERGGTVAEIAEQMPVGETSVSNILKGRTWKHVE